MMMTTRNESPGERIGSGPFLHLSCGEGLVDLIDQRDADRYAQLAQIPTAPSARTSFFSPDLEECHLTVPQNAKQMAKLRDFRAGSSMPEQ